MSDRSTKNGSMSFRIEFAAATKPGERMLRQLQEAAIRVAERRPDANGGTVLIKIYPAANDGAHPIDILVHPSGAPGYLLAEQWPGFPASGYAEAEWASVLVGKKPPRTGVFP